MRFLPHLSLVVALVSALACASQPPPSEPARNPPPPPRFETREAGMAPGTWQLEGEMTREEAEAAGLATPEDDERKKQASE